MECINHFNISLFVRQNYVNINLGRTMKFMKVEKVEDREFLEILDLDLDFWKFWTALKKLDFIDRVSNFSNNLGSKFSSALASPTNLLKSKE